MDTARELLAGSIGGIAGIIAGQPADVIKTRLQSVEGLGLLECIRMTWRNERLPGFYRGIVPPMAGAAAYNGFSFAGYSACQAASERFLGPGSSEEPLSVFVSGCGAGLLSTLATTPCELVKVRMQVQHLEGAGHGTLECVRYLLATGGLSRLYSGMGVVVLRDTPATGVYFGVYYGCKERLTALVERSEEAARQTLIELCAGGMAGVLSWGSIIPVDVVKTRLQAEAFRPEPRFRDMRSCTRYVLHTEGPRAFLRGSGPLLLRAFPVNAVTFVVYEKAIRTLQPA